MPVTRSFEEALDLARERTESTLARVMREEIFPHAAPSATGVWEGSRGGAWSSGFWAGLLWQRAALSGAARAVEVAADWTMRLAPLLERRTHDTGFVFSASAILGWEEGRVPACRDLALRAADRLAALYNPRAGVIAVGSEAEIAPGMDDATIEGLVNLSLLWWGWRMTGEERFREVAVSHAERTAAWHVAEDGRVIQSVHFDPATGELVRRETHQGSGPEGCWSRGQAWAIYGFAAAYQAIGEARFGQIADRAATYFVQRSGADRVPFACFDDPAQPDIPRDSSAAAIASAGLLLLAEASQDPVCRQRSMDRAEAILAALVAGYLTPLGEEDRRPAGMLVHGCYNQRAGWQTDHELVWGDYYLLEALRTRKRLAAPVPSPGEGTRPDQPRLPL
jgi:unsaturated chondroitin disaccharide hydrolase